jgi:hypothetical protein
MGVVTTVALQATPSLKKMTHLCLVDTIGNAQFGLTVGKYAILVSAYPSLCKGLA